MTTLWDTTGTDVVKALAAERRTGGAVLSGLALTLVVVADENGRRRGRGGGDHAAAAHPCRLLVVVRRQIDAPAPRLDAEVLVGGRLGPGEAVVMRMYGRLAPARRVGGAAAARRRTRRWSPGGTARRRSSWRTTRSAVFADRRITDVRRAGDPVAALRQRAEDFAPGDTDLAWTRTTPWRAELASAFDTCARRRVGGAGDRPSRATRRTLLLAGWLSAPARGAGAGRAGGPGRPGSAGSACPRWRSSWTTAARCG